MDYGVYSLDFDCELKRIGHLHPDTLLEYEKVSFHPSDEKAAAILRDTSVVLSDFNGSIIWQHPGLFECLRFSRNGDILWAVEKLNQEHLRLSVFDSISGSLLTRYEMKDELFDSIPSLSDIPNSDKMILELGAAQDGVDLFECEFQGSSLEVKKIFTNYCFMTPAWLPDGSKMLTLENDENYYALYSYPHYELLSEQINDSIVEDDLSHGYNMVYLKNGLAVVEYGEGRYFLFDPVRMEHLEEIVFQGFEPVPAHQLYKSLKDDDDELCSRLTLFFRIGNHLAASTWGKDADQAIIFIDEDIDANRM
jgi:hypothetical protein